jgi:hypothetical protein
MIEMWDPRGLRVDDGDTQMNWWSAETVAIVTAGTIYAKAFLETLGQRSGEGVADLSKRMGEVVRKRRFRRKGYLVGIMGATAILIVTEDLPDEARLALLDLDVTAEDVRGKTLRWDNEAMAWRAGGTED